MPGPLSPQVAGRDYQTFPFPSNSWKTEDLVISLDTFFVASHFFRRMEEQLHVCQKYQNFSVHFDCTCCYIARSWICVDVQRCIAHITYSWDEQSWKFHLSGFSCWQCSFFLSLDQKLKRMLRLLVSEQINIRRLAVHIQFVAKCRDVLGDICHRVS